MTSARPPAENSAAGAERAVVRRWSWLAYLVAVSALITVATFVHLLGLGTSDGAADVVGLAVAAPLTLRLAVRSD